MTGASAVWLYVVVAGALVTYVWRLLGVLLVSRINPQGAVLTWVRAVATALVAALVARMLFTPSGLLAHTALPARLGAIAVGVFAWRVAGRRVEPGVAAAVLAFLLLQQFFP